MEFKEMLHDIGVVFVWIGMIGAILAVPIEIWYRISKDSRLWGLGLDVFGRSAIILGIGMAIR